MGHYVQDDHLIYPELTMYQMIERMAVAYPNEIAYEFYDAETTYQEFHEKILKAARAFVEAGIKRDDKITICMPNCPQALVCFYAISRIGAVANMVHPQSAQEEITFYLNFSQSKMILTLDMFTGKVEKSLEDVDHPVTILVARMQDELPPLMKFPFIVTTGRKYLKYPNTDHAKLWTKFINSSDPETELPESIFDPKHPALILYSGGSTGTPKGILLSDLNMNALGMQCVEALGAPFRPGISMLSCMPVFHGFGLGVNIHTVLIHGAKCILMPTFNIKTYSNMIAKKKPNYIAGVPTIFEALLHAPALDGVDLSFLQGMFCGGDSLSIELKKKVDNFLKEHNADIQIREGYGLTECVTASCLTPRDSYKPGSIGIPFPDTTYAIVEPGTENILPANTEGEIIVSGPTVMLGYMNNPEETAHTLRVLPDGKTWMYTGDLGYIDEDGYVFFKMRIKRMIITNGYNVYPGQIENVIDGCPEVSYSCVIGVKDERRGQRVRAYIVLRDGVEKSEETKEKIVQQMRMKVAGYAMPKEIEFRDELPKTLVGKVAFRKLEEEANAEADKKKAEA